MSKCEWDELGTSYLTDTFVMSEEHEYRENQLIQKSYLADNGYRAASYLENAETWWRLPDGCYWRPLSG